MLKKRWWVVLLITSFTVAAAILASTYLIAQVYEAKTTLIIGRTPRNQDEKIQYDVILAYQKLIKTYSELAKSRIVAEDTIQALKLDITPEGLLSSLKVAPRGETQILEIIIQDSNPDRAILLSNTLSEVFVEKVRTMMNSDDVRLLDKARAPAELVTPNMVFNIAAGFLAGLFISLCLVIFLEHLDTTLRSEYEIVECLGLPVLESLPYTHGME